MEITAIPTSALFDHTPERAPMQVLVVDDEEHIRRILSTLLEKNGFWPTVAADLAGARAALRETTFDAVLTDLNLAAETGLDVLQEALRAQPDTARILMSAALDLGAVKHAVNGVGLYQVCEKPLDHAALLSTLDRACSLARVVREKERLQRALTERTRELERTNAMLQDTVIRRTGELLCGLLAALDWRDTESQAHSRRVAALARRLGQQLGLQEEDLADIAVGALLHDVGKIGVPDHILRKRGPLTPDEWALMLKHPGLGDALLRPIPIMQGARKVVAQHHERFDGSGYPAGLVGENIDLGARIFAVVDAHDAITSDRPHRAGRPLSAARELIALAQGSQLDPAVVAAYLAIPDADLRAIQESYQDGSPWTSLSELLTGLGRSEVPVGPASVASVPVAGAAHLQGR